MSATVAGLHLLSDVLPELRYWLRMEEDNGKGWHSFLPPGSFQPIWEAGLGTGSISWWKQQVTKCWSTRLRQGRDQSGQASPTRHPEGCGTFGSEEAGLGGVQPAREAEEGGEHRAAAPIQVEAQGQESTFYFA